MHLREVGGPSIEVLDKRHGDEFDVAWDAIAHHRFENVNHGCCRMTSVRRGSSHPRRDPPRDLAHEDMREQVAEIVLKMLLVWSLEFRDPIQQPLNDPVTG